MGGEVGERRKKKEEEEEEEGGRAREPHRTWPRAPAAGSLPAPPGRPRQPPPPAAGCRCHHHHHHHHHCLSTEAGPGRRSPAPAQEGARGEASPPGQRRRCRGGGGRRASHVPTRGRRANARARPRLREKRTLLLPPTPLKRQRRCLRLRCCRARWGRRASGRGWPRSRPFRRPTGGRAPT